MGKIHEAITTLNGGLEDIRHSLTTSKHPDPAQGHEAVMSEITGTLDVNANKNSGIVSSLTEVRWNILSLTTHFVYCVVLFILYSLVSGIGKNLEHFGEFEWGCGRHKKFYYCHQTSRSSTRE